MHFRSIGYCLHNVDAYARNKIAVFFRLMCRMIYTEFQVVMRY